MAIGITGMGGISALGGSDLDHHWEGFLSGSHVLQLDGDWKGCIPEEVNAELQSVRKQYPRSDRTVHLAVYAAEAAVRQAGWEAGSPYGVNIGSSRGATEIWERSYQSWSSTGRMSPVTSPATTLGNISSQVGQHLGARGPVFSHSITCSTALNAILNAVAWLEAGRCNRFLAGGAEAPLTPFTLAQMKALRIYAPAREAPFPCRALDLQKKVNSMVLGEGAAVFCLEKDPEETPLAWLAGLGWATEHISSPTGISAGGDCLLEAMQKAIEEAGNPQIDVVITHAPGTMAGDIAEYKAIERLFGSAIPPLANNKWMIGHTLGASGGLNLLMGVLLLRAQYLPGIPYLSHVGKAAYRHLLINAVGFGGNAVSLVLRQAE